MCKWGTSTTLEVTIQASHSYTGKARKKKIGIDSCIADIVQVFEDNNIPMVASCCGHGKTQGHITLADNTEIYIKTP